jgi:hypothetical protein
MTKIDLHIHTTVSDGALAPVEIAKTAIKNGLSYFSIADHDTVGAYDDELFEFLKDKNITLIPAVEISTKFEGKGVHVLGYDIDFKNPYLIEKLSSVRNARHIYLAKVTKKLEELGYKVNFEKLDSVDAVTKAHIALDVISNDENKELLTKNFGHIPSKGEFIETIMNENCPAYVEKFSMTPAQASEIIRAAGGKVVLAHPVAYAHEDGLNESDIEKIVDSMKPDGIEAYYIYVDRYDKKFNEIERWKSFAQKHNLFCTIGSDFHCDDGLRPLVAFVNESIDLSDEETSEIVKNLTEKK